MMGNTFGCKTLLNYILCKENICRAAKCADVCIDSFLFLPATLQLASSTVHPESFNYPFTLHPFGVDLTCRGFLSIRNCVRFHTISLYMSVKKLYYM